MSKLLDTGLDMATIKKLEEAVKNKPVPPEFTEEMKMRQETEAVFLETALKPHPDIETSWFKDGQALNPMGSAGKYQAIFEDKGDKLYCALAIKNLCNDDAGRYSVTAKNKFGETSNAMKLALKDPNAEEKYPGGKAPTFAMKPTTRQEGSVLHIECEIEAVPEPELVWNFGGNDVSEGAKYSMVKIAQDGKPNVYLFRLTVKDLCKEDGGAYNIKSSNVCGSTECTLTLNFG